MEQQCTILYQNRLVNIIILMLTLYYSWHYINVSIKILNFGRIFKMNFYKKRFDNANLHVLISPIWFGHRWHTVRSTDNIRGHRIVCLPYILQASEARTPWDSQWIAGIGAKTILRRILRRHQRRQLLWQYRRGPKVSLLWGRQLLRDCAWTTAIWNGTVAGG